MQYNTIPIIVLNWNMSRFNELAENHEEMIKFKDEHKRRNERLLKENAKLRKDNETLFSGI